MKFVPILGGVLVLLLPMGGIAETHEACPMSYDQFEVGVPHTDMESCPASMEAEGTYCRLSLVAEIATVFAFSDETDCIAATRSYYDDAFEITID